jgi:hypothetical protein
MVQILLDESSRQLGEVTRVEMLKLYKRGFTGRQILTAVVIENYISWDITLSYPLKGDRGFAGLFHPYPFFQPILRT